MSEGFVRKRRKYRELRKALAQANINNTPVILRRPADLENLLTEVRLLRDKLAEVAPEYRYWNALDSFWKSLKKGEDHA